MLYTNSSLKQDYGYLLYFWISINTVHVDLRKQKESKLFQMIILKKKVDTHIQYTCVQQFQYIESKGV